MTGAGAFFPPKSPKGAALLEFMVAPNHDSKPIKSCSPFVGRSFHHSPMTLAALLHLVRAASALADALEIPVELTPRILANFKHAVGESP